MATAWPILRVALHSRECVCECERVWGNLVEGLINQENHRGK